MRRSGVAPKNLERGGVEYERSRDEAGGEKGLKRGNERKTKPSGVNGGGRGHPNKKMLFRASATPTGTGGGDSASAKKSCLVVFLNFGGWGA